MEDKTLSTEPVILNSTTDDLALRAAPDINANLICRLKTLTPLKSLETRDATLAKLGVENQWLHVRTFDGNEGYAAAWYLKVADVAGPNAAMPDSASVPENVSSSPVENVPLVIKVTADQLALRTEPCVNDANLLLRFPVGTLLTTFDPQAKQKLGVTDQWLKVKDDAGHEGYVAAWYISL